MKENIPVDVSCLGSTDSFISAIVNCDEVAFDCDLRSSIIKFTVPVAKNLVQMCLVIKHIRMLIVTQKRGEK